MRPLTPRRVVLMVPKFALALRTGIAQYSAPPLLWDTLTCERNDEGFRGAKAWRPDGVIGMLGRTDLMKRARALRVPLVNVHGGRFFDGAAQIGCDHEAIGRLASDYLTSLGFSHYACAGFPNENPSLDRRLSGFIAGLGDRRADVYRQEDSYPPCPKIRGTFLQPDDATLHRWVWSLPKPCAVFASGDMMAARILRACLHFDVPVPEQMAILGVGDMPEFCLDLPIALSSVAVPWEQIGFDAGALLNGMMAGKKPPKQPVLLPPTGITVRRSTDVYAVADKRVADALRFIKANACDRISVADILKRVPMGRRVLERKFRAMLRRSPHDEILRVRLERAAQLVIQTNNTMESIAEDSGFSTVARLSVEFKKRFGLPPGAYRKQFHQRTSPR